MPYLLNESLDDIKVKSLQPGKFRRSRFDVTKWVENAKLKTAKIIRENNNKLADWFLNVELPNSVVNTLPVKVRSLLNLVKKTKYKKVDIVDVNESSRSSMNNNNNNNNKTSNNNNTELSQRSKKSKLGKPIKLSELSKESESAFRKNVIVYDMNILNSMDCLSQMSQLESMKSKLLVDKLNVLKGIKCNETIRVFLEKQGAADDTIIENNFTFTSKPETITNKSDIAPALRRMKDDILLRIDR